MNPISIHFQNGMFPKHNSFFCIDLHNIFVGSFLIEHNFKYSSEMNDYLVPHSTRIRSGEDLRYVVGGESHGQYILFEKINAKRN